MSSRIVGISGVCFLLALSVSSQPNKTSNDKYHPPYKSRSFVAANYTIPTANNPGEASKESDDESFDWHTSIKRPEWWLVILGFPTLFIVGWQAILMRQHAGHFKELAQKTADSARATQASAESVKKQTEELAVQNRNMVLRERARISILFSDEAEAMSIRTDSKVDMGRFSVNLENLGTTPAFEIVSMYDAFACNVEDAPASPHLFWTATPSNIKGGTWASIGPLTIDPRFSGEKPANPFYVFLRLKVTYSDVFQKRRRSANFLVRREFWREGDNGAVSKEFWIAVGNDKDNQETYSEEEAN